MKPCVIGIGNYFRGDDSAGLLVGKILENRLSENWDFLYCDNDMMELINLWQGRDSVFLIDACLSGEKEAGFLHVYHAKKEEVPAQFCRASTHLLDVSQAIELARALGKLPKELVFYGIEGANFQLEEGISKNLKEKLEGIAKEIETDIRERLCMR